MRPRMVVLGILCLAGVIAADAPPAKPKAPAPLTKAQVEAKAEADAKALGVTLAELKRLREFGYADAELFVLIKEQKRSARELITEREVVDEMAKVVADVEQRVHNMSTSKQSKEREKALKDAIAKIRHEHRASREEIKQILAKTSFLRDDELRRVVRWEPFDVIGRLTEVPTGQESAESVTPPRDARGARP